MSTIGRILAAARDRAGYSIQELSARTYIRESVLEGIERDDFGPCGGDFYARGHIKAVCRELGIEPAELIERFDAEYATGPTSPLMGGDAVWPVPPERSGTEGGAGADRNGGQGAGRGEGTDGKARGRDRRRPGGVLRPFRGPAGGGPREPDGGPAERPPAADEGVVVTRAGGVPERPSSSGEDPEEEAPRQGREPSAEKDAERAAAESEAARGAANDSDADGSGSEVSPAANSRREARRPRARTDRREKSERRPVRRPPAGPPEDEFDEEMDDAPWRRRWGTAAAVGSGAVADDGPDGSAAESGVAAHGAAEGAVAAGVGGHAGRGQGAEPDGPDDEEAGPAAAPSAAAVLADRARRHWPVAVALALAAAAVIAGIQAWPDEGGDRAAGSSGGGVADEAGAAERADAMAEKRSRREAVTQAQPAMSTTVRNGKRPDEVRVRVYALHRTWLSVTDGDGERVFAGAVKKGTTHIWSDRDELRFHVGNAGGIHLEVNGEEEGVPGGRGQVKYLTFSADDLAE